MMNLKIPSRFSSFYESFSDLIFATMAIFVLLMLVFMTMVNTNAETAQGKIKEMEKKIVKQATQIAETKSQRDNVRNQLDEVTRQIAKDKESVRAQGLDLVVAVDCTGSMSEALGHLVETLKTIARVMPKITSKFRLSIIGYRNNSSESLFYGNQKGIYSEEQDGGKSLDELDTFLNKLKAKRGLAPIGWAVDKALATLSRYSESKDYQGSYKILFLLGDMGPYERSWNDMAFNPSKKIFEDQITDKIAAWVKKHPEKHRVVSLFSGTPPNSGSDNYYEHQHRYSESLRFFKSVTLRAGQASNYTENPGKMLAYLLSAIVKGRE